MEWPVVCGAYLCSWPDSLAGFAGWFASCGKETKWTATTKLRHSKKMSGFGSRLCVSLLLVNCVAIRWDYCPIGRNLLVDHRLVLSLAVIYCCCCCFEKFNRKRRRRTVWTCWTHVVLRINLDCQGSGYGNFLLWKLWTSLSRLLVTKCFPANNNKIIFTKRSSRLFFSFFVYILSFWTFNAVTKVFGLCGWI